MPDQRWWPLLRRLIRSRLHPADRRELVAVVALSLLVLVAMTRLFACTDTHRVATFNIENFPRDARQVPAAFEAIAGLDAELIAVQEITDPKRFKREARARLGDTWRFASSADHMRRSALRQHVGVLYNREAYTLRSSRLHTELQLYRGARPALEVVLKPVRAPDRTLRVFVVHLKAGGDGAELRARQLDALAPVLQRIAADTDDDVLVLGDFNATSARDRDRIAALADGASLTWATAGLECSAYWDREASCVGSALDHMLVRGPHRKARAQGPCASEGCGERDRCPAFAYEVSDHCPVTLGVRF